MRLQNKFFDRSLDKPLRHVFKVKLPGCKNDYFDSNLNLAIFSVNYSLFASKIKIDEIFIFVLVYGIKLVPNMS